MEDIVLYRTNISYGKVRGLWRRTALVSAPRHSIRRSGKLSVQKRSKAPSGLIACNERGLSLFGGETLQ